MTAMKKTKKSEVITIGTFKDKTIKREKEWMGKNLIDLSKRAIVFPKDNMPFKAGECYMDDACIGYPVDDNDVYRIPTNNEIIYYFIPRKYVLQTLGLDKACAFLNAHITRNFLKANGEDQ